jgi:hypothetical protein
VAVLTGYWILNGDVPTKKNKKPIKQFNEAVAAIKELIR